MKWKDIGLLQRYVDLIVLGVVVLFGLYFVYSFVLSDPAAVPFPNESSPAKTAAEIEAELDRLARQVQSAANSETNEIKPREPQNAVAQAAERLNRSFLPSYTVSAGPPGLDPQDISVPEFEYPTYLMVQVPAPQNIAVRHDYAVLATENELANTFLQLISQNNQLDPRLAEERARSIATQLLRTANVTPDQPRDFEYATVGAEFNFDAYRRRYEEAAMSKPSNVHLLHQGWLNTSMVITDVILERQTLQPDGSWSEAEVVPLLPGQRDARNWPEKFTESLAVTAMNTIAQYEDELSRPPFPPLAAYSRPWRSPFSIDKPLTPAERARAVELMNRIKRVKDNISRIERKLAPAPTNRPQPAAPATTQPSRNWNDEDGGLPGDGGSSRPAAPGRPQPAAPTLTEREQAELQQLQEQLRALQTEYNQLVGDQLNVGVETRRTQRSAEDYEDFLYDDTDGVPSSPRRVREPRPTTPGLSDTQQQPDEIMQVWAHDLSVEPGKTYRYRLRVALLNPLFQKGSVKEEQREEFFNSLSLPSEPTEWSQPVSIRPQPQWFLVDSNTANETGTVEIWKIIDGVPRQLRLRVLPGDPLEGTITIQDQSGNQVPVRITTDAAAVDVPSDGNRMRYVDLRTGRIHERNKADDQNHPDLNFYKSERDMQMGANPQMSPTTSR